MRYGVIVLALACLVTVQTDFLPAQEKVGDEGRTAAAQELLGTMHLDKTFGESLQNMVDMQIKQNPGIAPFRKVMLDFFGKYMSWEAVKDDMAKIYAEEFTAEELKDLIAFYKTPTGQKAALRLPQLMNKGAELGMRRVQGHIQELQQTIAEEAKKAEQQK
jgi:hypothetical protein